MLDPKCKKCRAVGEKLFLKKSRCFSPKCEMIKRPYRPGLHGQKRKRRGISEYGQQLLEKQKMKLVYGVRERQFKKYFQEVSHKKGQAGALLIQKLERRLDNVVFRLGFVQSRSIGRHLVGHGHFVVNERRVDIPSYEVKFGDIIKIRPASRKSAIFADIKQELKKYTPPSWLALNKEIPEGKVIGEPDPKEIGLDFNTSLIIEHYSK